MNTVRIASSIGTVVTLLLGATAPAAGIPATAVTFAPGLEASVRHRYGADEVPALRAQILDSVSAALKSANGKCNLNIEVVMQRVAPSHPTMEQQLSNPSLDPTRTRFVNGGAALIGHLLGADGQQLSTVKYEHFADDDLRFTSAARDPWSDAKVSIGEFADKLVTACARQSSGAPAPH